MICAILDANVYVSAAIARDNASPAVRLVLAAESGHLEAITCPVLLGEVVAVLSRDKLRRYLSIAEVGEFVDAVTSFTTLAADPHKPYTAVCRDPDDDYLLALAVEHGVDALCSGDRDLVDLVQTEVAVCTPRQLIEQVDAQD